MSFIQKKMLNFYVLMICGIVGVGFISGAEIYEFFARFGKYSYFGIVIFILLIFGLTYKILTYPLKLNKIDKMQKNINNNKKYTFLTKQNIKSILVFINVLLISSAMISGLKVLSNKIFFNNYIFVFSMFLFLVFLILVFGVKGLEKVDYFVMCFIAFVFIFFVHDIIFKPINLIQTDFSNSINLTSIIKSLFLSGLFSALYVFMNIVQAEPLRIESKVEFSKKKAFIFSLIFSITLTLILIVFIKFLWINSDLCGYPMPYLEYFTSKSGFIAAVYIIGLFLAILTTLLSCLIGVKQGVNKLLNIKCCGIVAKKSKNQSNTITKVNLKSSQNKCLNKTNLVKGNKIFYNIIVSLVSLALAFGLSFINFSIFVGVIYPIIGAVNFVIFVFL